MKKFIALAALAVLALLEAALFWNAHLRLAAGDQVADPAARVLERASRVYPWDDRVEAALGTAYFEAGSDTLGETAVRDRAFSRSLEHFLRSLRLNPGAAAVHFGLAQTLQFMNYVSLPTPLPFFDEYKKAASLTGHNSQIFFEVGKVLLSRWESLQPAEKDFTLDILKKSLASKDAEKLAALLEVWALHGQDGSVIERILPEDAPFYRAYARFLGERSLAIAARLKALAVAESLEFARAKAELDQVLRGYGEDQGEDAASRLAACAGTFDAVRFYQDLCGAALIDPADYAQTRKTAYRLLAEDAIDRTRSLADPKGYIARYLDLEDDPQAVGDFEKFVRERGLVEAEDAGAARSTDINALAFELVLDFKQSRFKDITRAGALLERSALIIPEGARLSYVRILQLVGDSYLKLDYLYEAERIYRKALEAGPPDLVTLLRLEKCYGRLNDEKKAAEVRRAAAAILTPPDFDAGRRTVDMGATAEFTLVCDGLPSSFRVEFESTLPGRQPLLTAVLNGRVVAEGYAPDGFLAFSATPLTGANILQVTAVNGPATLVRIARTPAGSAGDRKGGDQPYP